MPDLLDSLTAHFGHRDFRPAQRPIVDAALSGADVLAVMPTGAGKSLCFQFPAVQLGGVSLVVSPLISLMKDQVDDLTRRGIPAGALHSMQSAEERHAVVARARDGAIRLLYVAPERFASPGFLARLREIPVARFVVDEAHCVSEWGHDFRPDYRRLSEAAHACRRADGVAGRPPVLAFTATATPEVRDDIVDLLGLQQPEVFVAGFDRPNICLNVRAVSGDREKRTLLPELVGASRALVYASTRKSAEDAAGVLVDAGVHAAAYHAGLADAERARVQDAFADGSLRVVCATNAFGMGIDRPDLEVVVHKDLPGSLEAYYQEIGRVGRDGRPATATLLWNYADVKTREFLIERRSDDEDGALQLSDEDIAHRVELERRKLRRMVAYADSTGCLRQTILKYFGDPAAGHDCGTCGNCRRRTTLTAEQVLFARKILSGVARGGERWGRRKIAAMLTGQVDDLPDALVGLTTTGLLRDHDVRIVEKWIDALEGAGALRASADVYRTLRLTAHGREVMAGRITDVTMVVPELHVKAAGRSRGKKAKLPVEASGAEPNEEIVDALRAWRRQEAARRQVPPYVILHDKTVVALATARPASLSALESVSGMGPAKVSQYGETLVRLITQPTAIL
ncbi:MAG: RecQ family ATP-dependent DNA helicase [Vicinamibacterales bacterium]